MKILIAPDAFKDALPADQVAKAMASGWLAARASDSIVCCPMADGGEGTLAVLQDQLRFDWRKEVVQGALGDEQTVNWGWLAKEQIAFIELATIAGLQCLPIEQRNPMNTSTYGLGQLILKANQLGAKKVILAIGGSSTNDAGLGMAAALGHQFFDQADREIFQPKGKDLSRVVSIDSSKSIDLTDIQFEIICDVNNPFFGEQGAAQIYAGQKGADAHEIKILDQGLQNIAQCFQKHFGINVQALRGAGAAGGVGAGAVVFLKAKLRPGVEMMLELLGFADLLQEADLVLTGEGKLDQQTANGKLVQGICQAAKKYGVPVYGLFGQLLIPAAKAKAIGLTAAYPLSNEQRPLLEALNACEADLKQAAQRLAALLKEKI